MDADFELIAIVETADTLGEGLIWDERTGDFLWTDIEGQRLHRYNLGSKTLTTLTMPRRLACMALTEDSDVLIGAFEDAIGRITLSNETVEWLLEPELIPGTRFNDGRVGPDGGFWIGTMVEDSEAAGGTDKGVMYRLAPDMSLAPQFDGFQISNGLCWSPDAKTMYFSDSPKSQVYRFDFNAASGKASNRQDFARLPDGISPDGAVTDSAGVYWSALWDGAAIAGFTPEGERIATVDVPTALVTCPVFGGPDLDHIACTTATVDLTDEQRAEQPAAGHMFIFRTSRTGTLSHRFAG